jgi:hypothetical protein
VFLFENFVARYSLQITKYCPGSNLEPVSMPVVLLVLRIKPFERAVKWRDARFEVRLGCYEVHITFSFMKRTKFTRI